MIIILLVIIILYVTDVTLLLANGTCSYSTYIATTLVIHQQKNRVLTHRQHGLRAGYSCSTQLISLIEKKSLLTWIPINKLIRFYPSYLIQCHIATYSSFTILITKLLINGIAKWLTSQKQHVLLHGVHLIMYACMYHQVCHRNCFRPTHALNNSGENVSL